MLVKNFKNVLCSLLFSTNKRHSQESANTVDLTPRVSFVTRLFAF